MFFWGKEKIRFLVSAILKFPAIIPAFFFVLILLHPFWFSKRFEISFLYTAKEPFKLSAAFDRTGDLFCPEKLRVSEFTVPESLKPAEHKISFNVNRNSYIGLYLSVDALNSDVHISGLRLKEKNWEHNLDIKTLIFPVDLKQKSIKFDPGNKISFTSGTRSHLHLQFPKYIRVYYHIDFVFLFYSILAATLFSALVFKLCWRLQNYRKSDYLFATAAIILLILPVVNINYFGKLSNENRLFHTFPDFMINQSLNKDFPKGFEQWLNDRIFGREQLIEWNNSIFGMVWLKKLNVSGTKNHPDNEWAFWGKENWMFTSAYNGINSVQHKNRFTEEELRICATQLTQMEKMFKKLCNAPMYIVITPDKESVYEEYYPEYLRRERKHPESRLEQLVNYLKENTNLKITSSLPGLLKEKEKYRMYYKTGTHWTPRAGAYAAKGLLKLMKNDFPHIDETVHSVKHWIPDTKKADVDIAMMLKYKTPTLELPLDMLLYDAPVFNHAAPKKESYPTDYLLSLIRNKYTLETGGHNRKRLKMLAITDSFWLALMPHLSPHVTDIYHFFYGHGKDFVLFPFTDEIISYNPDIVVIETTERFLHRFLTVKFGE